MATEIPAKQTLVVPKYIGTKKDIDTIKANLKNLHGYCTLNKEGDLTIATVTSDLVEDFKKFFVKTKLSHKFTEALLAAFEHCLVKGLYVLQLSSSTEHKTYEALQEWGGNHDHDDSEPDK